MPQTQLEIFFFVWSSCERVLSENIVNVYKNKNNAEEDFFHRLKIWNKLYRSFILISLDYSYFFRPAMNPQRAGFDL